MESLQMETDKVLDVVALPQQGGLRWPFASWSWSAGVRDLKKMGPPVARTWALRRDSSIAELPQTVQPKRQQKTQGVKGKKRKTTRPLLSADCF